MGELAYPERKRLHVPELTGAAVQRGDGSADSSSASESCNTALKSFAEVVELADTPDSESDG